MTEYLGYLAAILTTGAFLPQAIKTIRTRDTSGISLTMYCLLTIGLILWLIYGFRVEAKPIIYANAVTGAFAIVILFYKLKSVLNRKD